MEDIIITTYEQPGYMPVIDYDKWRVAILNTCEELEISELRTMQKHCETDEVFVLLKGKCTLFTGGNGEEIGEIRQVTLEPFKLYNVKKGVWHTHTLEKDTSVLIVENRDTDDSNSPIEKMTNKQIATLRNMYKA